MTTIKADQLTCQGGEGVGDVTPGFFKKNRQSNRIMGTYVEGNSPHSKN